MPPHEFAARCHEAGFDLHVARPADVRHSLNASFRGEHALILPSAVLLLSLDTKSVDIIALSLYCGPRNIQEAPIADHHSRLFCAVLVILSSSLKFLSLRTGAVMFLFQGILIGYRYCQVVQR